MTISGQKYFSDQPWKMSNCQIWEVHLTYMVDREAGSNVIHDGPLQSLYYGNPPIQIRNTLLQIGQTYFTSGQA